METGSSFDDGLRGHQPLYTIVKFRETPASSQVDNKTNETQSIINQFSGMTSSFSALTYGSIIKHSMKAAGEFPEDLKKAMNDNKHMLLIVGYFIPGASHASNNEGPLGAYNKPISVEDVKASKIYYAGYRIGMDSESLEAYALVNPDRNSVCELAPIPGSMSRIFFKRQFLAMDEETQQHRIKAVKNVIAMITNPGEEKRQQNAELLDEPSVIYQEITEADYTIKARLAYLRVKLESTAANDPSTAEEISAELAKLKIRFPGTHRNLNIIRMLQQDEEFNRQHAVLALQEAKELWPNTLGIKVMDKIDAEHIYKIAVALKERLNGNLVVDYNIMASFLGFTIILDNTGQMSKYGANSEEWAEHLKMAYEFAKKISRDTFYTANPKKEQPKGMVIDTTAALNMVELDLEALKEMVQDISTTVKQQAARCFGFRSMPLPMTLKDAVKGLANTHEASTARVYTERIYAAVADKFHDMLIGPILRHADTMLNRVDSIILVRQEAADKMDADYGKAWMERKRNLDREFWRKNFPRMPEIPGRSEPMDLSVDTDCESSGSGPADDNLKDEDASLHTLSSGGDGDSLDDSDGNSDDNSDEEDDDGQSLPELEPGQEDNNAETLLHYAHVPGGQKDYLEIHKKYRHTDDSGIDKVEVCENLNQRHDH
ncbi:hypothetical protein LX36DRAFT_709093 [Colletotrichum falcatum]|nr:hypothetical protein LX36DRAFT_709093 [Colletotrichum falcatum]